MGSESGIVHPSVKITTQIMRFVLVGTFTVILDYAALVTLVEIFHFHYLIATTVGFALGSGVNYVLSIRFVFQNGKYRKQYIEILVFILITVVGLLFNYFLMKIFTEWVKLVYWQSKIFSIVFVSSTNYLMKKVIVFRN